MAWLSGFSVSSSTVFFFILSGSVRDLSLLPRWHGAALMSYPSNPHLFRLQTGYCFASLNARLVVKVVLSRMPTQGPAAVQKSQTLDDISDCPDSASLAGRLKGGIAVEWMMPVACFRVYQLDKPNRSVWTQAIVLKSQWTRARDIRKLFLLVFRFRVKVTDTYVRLQGGSLQVEKIPPSESQSTETLSWWYGLAVVCYL
ncbi:hypothetical protein BDZ89DRAFT_1112862 [Hymenopellis radicata]|nr:hypothetical protein BDZ89DRAFT_1112862 [Hymenopellis radicata]